MIMALTQVLGVSAVALISQAVGRKNQEQANLVFNLSLVLSAVCAVITLLGGYLLAESYLGSITADDAALREGLTFLYWFLPGMALQFAMIAMASSLRATGIVKPAMIVQVLTVVLNTILAPILIAGWGQAQRWAFLAQVWPALFLLRSAWPFSHCISLSLRSTCRSVQRCGDLDSISGRR
jgi:Na+-driven multidrug efflux pump